jgi:hypothetical protein
VPARQGAKAQDNRDISSFGNAAGRKCIGALKCDVIFARALKRIMMDQWHSDKQKFHGGGPVASLIDCHTRTTACAVYGKP